MLYATVQEYTDAIERVMSKNDETLTWIDSIAHLDPENAARVRAYVADSDTAFITRLESERHLLQLKQQDIPDPEAERFIRNGRDIRD
jgi:hypothetical protein